MPEQYTITGTIILANGTDRAGIKVQAFDRDLPSLERRGNAPQLLGESPLDANSGFRIDYTDDRFRQGEGEFSTSRISTRANPDLSFRIFDSSGQELNISRTLVGDREYRPDQIIFNAPPELTVTIYVEVRQESTTSEYARLVAAIAPVIQDVSLVELTTEDVDFLMNELALDQQRDTHTQIEWLRRSALLANQTNVPIEAFYGWGRVNIPAALAELAATPIAKWQPLVKKLLRETNDRLRDGLRTAIAERFIPDLGDRMNDILVQLDRLRVQQGVLTARRFVGKLFNERTNEPLISMSVQGFDVDAGQEPKDLGQTISNNEGVFAFSYNTVPSSAGDPPKRRIRLQVFINPQTQESFQTEIQAGGDQELLSIRVPIALPPEPESHQLTNLASTLAIELPPTLLPFLAGKHIHTLADLRRAGGIGQLERLPVAVDNPAVQLLEAHTDLSRISPDVQLNALIIQNNYNSVAAIAKASRPDFVRAIRDRVGDFKAAQLQVAARAQTQFLNNLMVKKQVDFMHGVGELDLAMADKMRCRCRDCESAVSPLAYLADLLTYATSNIKNNKLPIHIQDLANLFHQPFDLPTSCEAVDTQIRQVRLCVEVLRRYLGARPLADTAQEAKLAKAETDYLLAVYAALLTKIGTNYGELRLSRSGEPALRQSLADRLGIDLSHLNSLFLDPSATLAVLTEAAIERLFGLVDTSRDPFTPASTPEFQTWRLEQLRTLWKSQDFPADGSYEEGENAIALQRLPASVVFETPLDAKVRYDGDRQQLIFKGEMTPDERSTLLALDRDPLYQQAVKQLFQVSQRLPIIDPDLIGPDDIRRPFLKTNSGDPDRAFDLWKRRRDWVDLRLQAFAVMTKRVPGQAQPVPDIAAMFAAMYQPVTYGTIRVTAWANTTPSAGFETLRSQLNQGVDVHAIKLIILDDLHLSVDQFTHVMDIAAKYKVWENDTRREKVKDEEWQDVASILVQAQKGTLYAAWRQEEKAAGVRLGPQDFWIAQRQPLEGEWPPTVSTKLPLIDPTTIKLKDLPEGVVGERAVALWQTRQARLEQIPKELATERQTNGFDALLKLALGNPNPGNPLQFDLAVLKSELSHPDPTIVANATTKITDDLHLTVENFKRLLGIKSQNDDPDPQKKPTEAEWAELYAILTPARKVKHEFPLWIREENNAVTGVLYWNALKATLPRWRSASDARQFWQQSLRNHSQPAMIDPDLIGPRDLKNPVAGDLAFDLWKAREVEVGTQLTRLAAEPKTLAGVDTNFQSILGISVAQFLKIADDQDKGYGISDRLVQLSLEATEFNYLLRLSKLVSQTQPILDLEWESAYSILVQVWKRRQSAQWRSAEQAQTIQLSSDFFKIPSSAPIQLPPKEPTVADIWRFSRVAYQEWQDRLQSRLDQEQTTIQSVAEAVSAAEEATLPFLRDALVLVIPALGDAETKATWVVENLLIDARMSGCSLTTRVAQAIETIQGLILALRTGQLADLYNTFALNLDGYDEKWKWIGSYPSWRSAMFVFLYPETILQPSLRKWQTPAFQELVKNTGADRRLAVSDACLEARKYAEYFRDICTLRVEASCTSRTHLTKDRGCSESEMGYGCLLYMFGRGGVTNTVYWSAYDPQDYSGYAQTFWSQIDDVKGLENIVEIIGATPYQVNPNQRYIFLFLRKLEDAHEKLICAKYDLENRQWVEESLPLGLPDNVKNFSAVVKQLDVENEPPHLAICDGTNLFEKRLNLDGTGWEKSVNSDFPVIFRGVTKVEGMVTIFDRAFYLMVRIPDDILAIFLFVLKANSRTSLQRENKDDKARYKAVANLIFGRVRYLGMFSWPEREYIYVVFAARGLSLDGEIRGGPYLPEVVLRIQDEGFPNLPSLGVVSPFPEVHSHIVPTSGRKNTFKYFVSQSIGSIAYTHRMHISDEGDRLTPTVSREAIPSVSGPFNIPIQASSQDLQIRKSLVQKAFESNSISPTSNISYLEEAYYFVPLTLALSLQRSGDYIAALDVFRTVYDYAADNKTRKIYYGLVREEALLNTYKRGADWLLDPLNPHAIAATRQHTYTRFTLLAIVRCLLDYADAEFTRDTPESNPRARRLYLTALELLDSDELKQRENTCDEVIGVLDDIPVVDDRWAFNITQFKEDLKVVTDLNMLRPVVEKMRQALMGDGAFEQRFANAKAIVNQAMSSLPPVSSLVSVIHENGKFNHLAQRSILADSSLVTALESVSTAATGDFQRTIMMVTGISPARLELRAVDLPWLREPILRPTNVEHEQTGSNLAVARRDMATLDILAPSYMTNLSEIAAFQPMNAVNLAMEVKEFHVPQLIIGFCIPPNPILKALRLRAELNLYKLRTCRNIAGLKRQVEPYAAPTDTTSGFPAIGTGGQLVLPGISTLHPSLYRYPVLIERAKQLVQFASQVESVMLSSLINRDAGAHTLLQARQQISLAQAGVQLQDLRIGEAKDGVTLAELQKKRAQIQIKTYEAWLLAGANQYENQMIDAYETAATAQKGAADASNLIQLKQSAISSAQLAAQIAGGGGIAGAFVGGVMGGLNFTVDAYLFDHLRDETKKAISETAAAQIASIHAALERRKDEWQLQRRLAEQDSLIGDQQKKLATDHVEIVTQERVIAAIGADNAKDSVEFLANKFTNVKLFDWMSNVLEGVYSFFLQQATAMAKLGENQLAFERQEIPPALINSDYWEVPSENSVLGNTVGQALDRRGLTGSARLLQDIYRLDQYAFASNKRKLPLTKIFSLARLAPVEFQRFRETGVMPFTTSMELFDRGFPGHYLRLIKRVRTAVIALIPSIDGIHATLSTTGPSRVVIGGDVFQSVVIRRAPEFIAMSAPNNSTGVFELDPQPDMLLPFEGSGVEMSWEFNMPKAANLFDYRAIADVLITIEYTALNSFDYRQQVIETLNPNLSSDRPFSFRNQFADQWYDLHNPDQTSVPMTVRFKTVREDFPPNLDALKIQQVLLYFVRADAASFEVPVTHLRYTAKEESGAVGGSATSIDGVISTRRGNAGSWVAMIGKTPAGEWELALPNTEEMKSRFKNKGIVDILLVITYSGRTPEWPS